MEIRDLFTKPIDRPINGVIKADQLDAESVWQELEEYVVTKQLTEYFRKFFDAYLAAAEQPKDSTITARMGVWVSGFFGSGKSHYIKILSYLLENIEAIDPKTGTHKKAADFFDEHKIKDAMLLADIHKAIKGTADVMLFNIDAKADTKTDRDAIVQVFLRVFNEKLGLCGDAPHIAEMERYLISKGAYETFKTAFHAQNGTAWQQERDAVDFLRDDVIAALAQSLNMSIESAGRWFDNARDDYRINIESFAKLIRDYLETKPADHRVIFLVDEVGQFIGDNTQLMLSLQTIIEQLGTLCQGRAWVIVTSQEDIDAAIGEANKARSQDFSKIQARFHTRLSLASSNTDEVIGERLLAKTEQAHVALRDTFAQKGDIINNQLSFVGNAVNLRGYRDAAEYVAYYPFAPYQFQLLQKIFESIRKVGATGKHLSRGERSLLDAFQSAAVQNANKPINALIPLYDFYPSIESFIDSIAKRSIDQAPYNDALEPYDTKLLKALFLIRYISETVKPTIDNLATLCVDEVDADKLNLKRKLQESLARLEQQQLVSRNGDLWFFLTNEERDVARELGHVEVSSSERTRLLSELIFEDILKSTVKVRHRDTKGDYEFNRLIDGAPWKTAAHALTLEVLSPLGDDYERMQEATCIMRSAEGTGRAILRMAEGQRLFQELTLYLQIEKYIISPKAGQATPSLKRILTDRKDENRERKTRLVDQLSTLMATGDFYVLGQKPDIKAGLHPTTLLDELINYLIANTYSKLPYLKYRCADPVAEIKAVLTTDDVAQTSLDTNNEEINPLALNELRQYLLLAASENRVLLSDVVDRFSGIPWGWKPEWEIVLLVARLYMAGEIKLMLEGADIDPRAAIDPLTKSVRFRQVSILKRKSADSVSLKRARDLHRELFSKLPREDEDGLVSDTRDSLASWQTELKSYVHSAASKYYPGKSVIEHAVTKIGKQLAIRDSYEFIDTLLTGKNDWLDLADEIHDVLSFYKTQISTWQRLLEAMTAFEDNKEALQQDAGAANAIKELLAIRDNPTPYGQINRIDALLSSVEAVNERLAAVEREAALLAIDQKLTEIGTALDQIKADVHLRNKALLPTQKLKISVAGLNSIPKIRYLAEQAGNQLDTAMDTIAAAQKQPAPGIKDVPPGTPGTDKSYNQIVTPQQKPITVIRAQTLGIKSYLETEAEVDDYLAKLKQALLAVLKEGKRARID
ncbi:MAG: BREX system P-loop protein BrxC [Methylococcaceae bacterium]|nr:BREX system P-loop protein BrxC [Methylococcaceae bacterium]MDP2394278.1 BREX system P-loop protein BrxC [Methylococcaceae bacterium]MDP3019373.1 BREX system P-loop protein BrxC [Methylococcaceae bacterium]MDP3390627.1 BREX system P-loop protein BrxC [Methylococcaceae bacterium]MDZ4155416.1 BREX system P-loop protein BrxC [Methylococcales bacterium]